MLKIRAPETIVEKEEVKRILSVENDMWYEDIELDKISVLVNDIVIGCGRIIEYPDCTKELASVAIKKELQRKGYGRYLINSLLEDKENIYVICEGEKEELYEKFNFKKIEDSEVPKFIYLKLEEERKRFPEDNSISMKYVKNGK